MNTPYIPSHKLVLLLFLIVLGLPGLSWAQDTYYINSIEGNDAHSGLSMDEAWKSMEKASQVTYGPGDSILFKKGCYWTGFFSPGGNGAANMPIVVAAYGSGEKPVLDASGVVFTGEDYSTTIRLFNQEYWEFRDIHIKNHGPTEEKNDLVKYGILVEGRDTGTLHGFIFRHVMVSDVNGSLDTRENGGICMLISRSSNVNERIPTNFDGILVDSCYFFNTSRSGFFTVSHWKLRDFSSQFGEQIMDGRINDWFPSYNIIVRNSRFEEIGGNGLVIRVADGPLVEHNYFNKCSKLTTGNASYPYNCDNALWQFNEACSTIYHQGDPDAGGFDSDYFCKNTIIQYNYSHDNEWGGLLVCNNGKLSRAFNNGTIVRYNVFQNDGHHSIRISGPTSNTFIYNNVIYVGENFQNLDIIWHKSWHGYSDKTYYFNNIFYNKGVNSNFNFGESTNNVFSHNVFYGNAASNQPDDIHKVISDPLLVDPGKGSKGFETLEGYKLQNGSPAIDAGKNLYQNDVTDFYGNPVPNGNTTDIGIHEYQGSDVAVISVEELTEFSIEPNPATVLTILNIKNDYMGKIDLSIMNSSGRILRKEKILKNGINISRVINLEEFQVGTYFIHIGCQTHSDTLKLIKL